MNVKIDIDIAQNVLQAYARRNRDQIRVYGILLGTIEGKDTYHVKDCIYGYIYESKEGDGSEQSNTAVEFKRLNDTITNTLFNSYHTNFPNYSILGGFSTDKELFMELFYLYNTINDIYSKTIQNKNKILMLIDPWHKNDSMLDYGIQVFNWQFEEESKVMAYKKIHHQVLDSKVVGSILHSNLINKEQMLLNLQHSDYDGEKGLQEILEEVRKSVDEEIKFLPTVNDSNSNMNLYNVKKQLLLTDRFLIIIDHYLTGDVDKLDEDILHQIDFILQELVFYFDQSGVMKIIEQEFKQTQIIDSLTNLLNLQIKITEKINKFNL